MYISYSWYFKTVVNVFETQEETEIFKSEILG